MSESTPATPQAKRPGALRRLANWIVARFMPDDATELARRNWLNRQITSVLLYLCTAGVIWIVTTLASVRSIAERLDVIAIALDGTYRADVARRDIEGITRRLDLSDAADRRHETSIDAVARRVDRVEYIIQREHHVDLRGISPAPYEPALPAAKVKP